MTPSLTPVCFASMFTGAAPEVHGIFNHATRKVVDTNTLFDVAIRGGKKCALITNAPFYSMSIIFRERDMDYYTFEDEDFPADLTERKLKAHKTVRKANEKALELIEQDIFDLLVVYNGDYDGNSHLTWP